jgi:hypothetical protein
VPFTLAGVASLPNHARAQVIRRSAGRAESEPDVIELPTNSATADDLADAVREFLDANASARPGADATTPISNTGKGNSSKVGNRSKVYENLLKELRKADHKTIDAVGDAGTIKVLVIQ